MNKRYLCVALVAVAIGYARPAAAQSIGGGFKGGINWSTVSSRVEVDDGVFADKDMRTGLVIGGFLTFNLVPGLSLQPEVLYSQQGVKISAGGDEATAEIDYVQIPVLLRIGAAGKGAGGVYALAGASFGFASSRKITQSGQPDVDLEEAIKSNDSSIVVGLGVTVSRFLIEGRYSEGLTDINEDTGGAGPKNRNRVFAALVGVHF